MPIYALSDRLEFPHPELTDPSGILAVGGDLRPERLLLAYQLGIFPWFNADEPPMWWCPDPRMVLYPGELKVSKSMRSTLNRKAFKVTCDQAFEEVIQACGTIPRPGQDGTWITPEIISGYSELHRQGFAHSVEVWSDDTLVGGLYGVSLGRAFFGESMFSRQSNASKYGFISLVQALADRGFSLIDCQVHTEHLASLGAKEIDRDVFLEEIAVAQETETMRGSWTFLFP
ncbi:leucyl/phenylalanyl-tRNA--protein transferase [Cryomorphaceae bacterium]|nr:leucyl/phenylalanyl-tRNA--protein transferase [Cryomorphaceae bacterium]